MSGSGGGGLGGGSLGDTPVACERLVIETILSSPKANVVAKLQVGYILDVRLEEQAGTVVVALYFGAEKAGGITSASTNRLRECIDQGTQYTATVMSVVSGQINVRIKPIR
jgi:hypothetical protein